MTPSGFLPREAVEPVGTEVQCRAALAQPEGLGVAGLGSRGALACSRRVEQVRPTATPCAGQMWCTDQRRQKLVEWSHGHSAIRNLSRFAAQKSQTSSLGLAGARPHAEQTVRVTAGGAASDALSGNTPYVCDTSDTADTL